MGQLFPPEFRLRESREFRSTKEKGRRFHTTHFLVYVAEKSNGPARLGVTASRKIGGAVQRNRVKRLVREFFRLHRQQLASRADISVIAKKGAPALDLRQVCRELDFLRGADSR
jgi:ribonuclease P protein component